MFWRNKEDKTFVGVAMTMILIGAAIVSFAIVGWLVNVAQSENIIAFPSIKFMGGLIITALGYIQLELAFLRRK